MNGKIVSGITLTLFLLISTLTLTFNIQPVKASETIYIRADGSIDPPTAPLQRSGDIYTFTSNISDSIVIERDSIVLDGNGYGIEGDGSGEGFDLSNRNNVTVKNTHVKGFDHGIYLYYSGTWYGNTILNNTCNSAVYLYYSYRNNVTENIIKSAQVRVEHSNDNTIASNTIENGWLGLLYGSSSNVVRENVVAYTCKGSGGIELHSSCINNVVESNRLDNNDVGIGISLASDSNIIQKNILDNNTCGIVLVDATNNVIRWNNITNNRGGDPLWAASGVALHWGTNANLVYHNSFINNAWPQAFNELECGNYYNVSYPGGGNYWSDYSGLDSKSGPNQNQPGSDGIGDTPYTFSGGQDGYPLMKPIQPGNHDILVTNITLAKTVVGQNYSTSIDLTVKNQGDCTETFNLTVYANTTVIETQTVNNMLNGTSTVLTFTWNTTGFAKGNYTIRAVADTVLGETYTDDNTRTDGTVLVTIPGDLDGNFTVQLVDLVVLAQAYGSKPGDGNWNPNADIDGNGIVGLTDLVIMARNYGKTDP